MVKRKWRKLQKQFTEDKMVKMVGNFEVNDWAHWKKMFVNTLAQEKQQVSKLFT